MAKAAPLKIRIREGGAHIREEHKKKARVSKEIDRIEDAEERLETAADEILSDIAELENVKKSVLKEKSSLAWIKGKVSELLLQDFVGAAFGAMFFAVTQEVWDLAAKLSAFGIIALISLSLILGWALINASRRRKFVSTRVEKTVALRVVEVYAVSFLTALLFILVLRTATGAIPILKQTILITLPAVVSAATADLLFF